MRWAALLLALAAWATSASSMERDSVRLTPKTAVLFGDSLTQGCDYCDAFPASLSVRVERGNPGEKAHTNAVIPPTSGGADRLVDDVNYAGTFNVNRFTFVDAGVDTGADTITKVAHGLTTGYGPVQFTNSGGALPTGISAATSYWVIRNTADTIKLAPTEADARNGTNIVNITALGGGTNTLKDNSCHGTADDITCSLTNTLAFFPQTDIIVVAWGTNDVKGDSGVAGNQWDDRDDAAPNDPIWLRDVAAFDTIMAAVGATGIACAVVIPAPQFGNQGSHQYTELLRRGEDLRQLLVAKALEYHCGIADWYEAVIQRGGASPWLLFNNCPAPGTSEIGHDCIHFESNATGRAFFSPYVWAAMMSGWRMKHLPLIAVTTHTNAGIEAALDLAAHYKGAHLYLPADTYPDIQINKAKLAATLLRRGLIVEGAGDTTVLQYPIVAANITDAMWHLDNTPNYFFLESMKLDGMGTTGEKSSGCTGSAPLLCAQINLHTAISGNSGANVIKSYIGLPHLTITNWPHNGIAMENAEYVGIVDLTASNGGCDITDNALVDPYVTCSASWGAGLSETAFLASFTTRVSKSAIIESSFDKDTKYCVAVGSSNGVQSSVDQIYDLLISDNTFTNCRGNAIHSANYTAWMFNTHTWPDTTNAPDCSGILGCYQIFVGEYAHDDRIVENSVESLGPGIGLLAASGYNNLVRDIDIGHPCIQDSTSGGSVWVHSAAGWPNIAQLTLAEISVTADANNYCINSFDIGTVDALAASELTGNANIRLRDSAAGTLDTCTLSGGATLTNETLPGAMTVTACP